MQDIINQISVLGIPFLPLILISAATQLLKKKVYVNLVDKLQKVLSWVTPLVLAAAVHAIFSMPNFEIWTFLQNTLGSWAFAVLGFDGIKALFPSLSSSEGK